MTMGMDGKPENSTQHLGEQIARLRTKRHWSRAKLLVHLYNELDSDDRSFNTISESWLTRLENGRVVKVPRTTIEALCRALQCTPQERANILLHADRNVLSIPNGNVDNVAELLNYTVHIIHKEASDILRNLIADRPVIELDEAEILELASQALALALSAHNKDKREE